ncbi:hypothetical protein LWM68_12975 [Niabella sp. W65]|nr:hypothetical protein [Niabella sp. W65]MCH7363582.1 hypothetical protein [Niabella sp. W65]ULT39497.1 hypothetical protein KRR40_31770 [Niabella sp. I65]
MLLVWASAVSAFLFIVFDVSVTVVPDTSAFVSVEVLTPAPTTATPLPPTAELEFECVWAFSLAVVLACTAPCEEISDDASLFTPASTLVFTSTLAAASAVFPACMVLSAAEVVFSTAILPAALVLSTAVEVAAETLLTALVVAEATLAAFTVDDTEAPTVLLTAELKPTWALAAPTINTQYVTNESLTFLLINTEF